MALIFLLAVALALMRAKPFEKLPFIGGYKPLVVLGGSMEPAIKVGSVVLVRKVEPSHIKVGDIITFRVPLEAGQLVNGERPIVTHRVIDVSRQKGLLTVKTEGDANENADNWKITEHDVMGQAKFYIPYFGYLSHYVRKPVGFILLVIVPGLLIMLIEIRKILLQIRLARGTVDA